MTAHFASRRFWEAYGRLPEQVRQLADRNFLLLKNNQRHPSLHFRKVGRYWSARIGAGYRALGVEVENGALWIWIGTHAQYDLLIRS
jgi:hypothetical protein